MFLKYVLNLIILRLLKRFNVDTEPRPVLNPPETVQEETVLSNVETDSIEVDHRSTSSENEDGRVEDSLSISNTPNSVQVGVKWFVNNMYLYYYILDF